MFIIVVNWNLKNDTEDCIRSLERAGAHLSQIIVVDNGSNDDSVTHLRAIFGSSLDMIQLDSNLGLAAAANLGIRKAVQKGAEWLMLINNDTWVAEDFFDQLFKAVDAYPQYSIFGPAIYYAERSDIIWYLGERLIPGTMLTVNKYRGKAPSSSLSNVLPMDFLSGCAMLVNNQAFRDAGLWDAGLFMYGEEVDWCWRARMAGYRLAAVPSAIMWHKVSASSNYVSSKNRYLRIRNQIWGYRRYGNFLHFLYLVIFTFFRVLYMSIRDLKFGDKNLIISSWKGLAAGWFQEVPPILESMEQ